MFSTATLDPLDFPPGVLETAELRRVPTGGLEVPFDGNSITLSGGIVATVGLPNFYADGVYQWACFGIDAVSATTVPAPTSFLLLGLGLVDYISPPSVGRLVRRFD